LSQNDDRDAQVGFWEDLRKEAQEWLWEGDQLIIGGDVNNEVRDPAVETFFSDLGTHNLIFEHHSPDGAPTTYFRNTNGQVMDSLWGTANISAVRCGYLEPKEMEGDQAAIEAALFLINKAKVHSSEDTDFLQPPLVDVFGYRGNEAIEKQVLQGTYVPPALASCHAKLFLSQCTLPDDLPLSDTAISMADHSGKPRRPQWVENPI